MTFASFLERFITDRLTNLLHHKLRGVAHFVDEAFRNFKGVAWQASAHSAFGLEDGCVGFLFL
jgi:hypothetical protein